jgi:hypothetical protein
VFADPTIHTCIVILSPGVKIKSVKIRKQITDITQLKTKYDYEIDQANLGKNENSTFDIFIDPLINSILVKLAHNYFSLGSQFHIRQCIKTGNDDIYVKQSEIPLENPWKPTLRGKSISRYAILVKSEYVKYGKWLARNWQNKSFYETPKIAIRETVRRIIATLDIENRYFLSSLYSIYPKSTDNEMSLKFLLGILNSSLATFVAKVIALDLTEGAFTKIRTNQLSRIPIRTIDFSNPADVARHDQMIILVQRMLDLHKQTPVTPFDQERLTRDIASTAAVIDRLVYDLYGLTEEEIKIVESS